MNPTNMNYRLYALLLFAFVSMSGYSQIDSTYTSSLGLVIGSQKETVLKRRMKRLNKQEIVIKGYYQEVIAITTDSDRPKPIYGKKKRFRRVESTVRDREFRRKFGI
jgi:membrane-bound lytic murein transglycosylase